MREEGYQEANGGPGLNLDVAPYFANSLRGAIGADIKTTISLWGFDLTPEARLGYRYDLLQQAGEDARRRSNPPAAAAPPATP